MVVTVGTVCDWPEAVDEVLDRSDDPRGGGGRGLGLAVGVGAGVVLGREEDRVGIGGGGPATVMLVDGEWTGDGQEGICTAGRCSLRQDEGDDELTTNG